MQTFLLGFFLVLHGLAHAAVGMAAQDRGHGIVVSTALFAIAIAGFVAAGFGMWGIVGLKHWWRILARGAILASALLLVLFARSSVETAFGLAFDLMALVITGVKVPGGLRRVIPTVGGSS